MRECANCKGRSELTVCWPCGKAIRRQLVGTAEEPGLAWLIDRLQESAYGEAKIGRLAPKVSGQGERPGLPLNAKAAELLRDILRRLHKWSEGALWRLPAAAQAAMMADNVPRLMARDDAAEILRELLRLRAAAERAIDLPPDLQYVGTCPSVFADGPRKGEACAVGLYVERGESTVNCPRCKTPSVVEDLQRTALERVDDEPKTAADMYRLLRWLGREVPRSSFYVLVRRVPARMYLHRDGRRNLVQQDGSQPLYAYSEVVAAIGTWEAEQAAQRAAGKGKRGRPRKAPEAKRDTVGAAC
ncbi:LamD-like protein [Mycobacterium phage BoostSeason]|nr:LamD-like protein [Mycobacterium phage BoostSeason]